MEYARRDVDALDAEFGFDLDCAAANHRCARGLGPNGDPADARAVPWGRDSMCGLSPPYSRVRAFIEKAAQEAQRGCTVVAIVPARTDTRW